MGPVASRRLDGGWLIFLAGMVGGALLLFAAAARAAPLDEAFSSAPTDPNDELAPEVRAAVDAARRAAAQASLRAQDAEKAGAEGLIAEQRALDAASRARKGEAGYRVTSLGRDERYAGQWLEEDPQGDVDLPGKFGVSVRIGSLFYRGEHYRRWEVGPGVHEDQGIDRTAGVWSLTDDPAHTTGLAIDESVITGEIAGEFHDQMPDGLDVQTSNSTIIFLYHYVERAGQFVSYNLSGDGMVRFDDQRTAYGHFAPKTPMESVLDGYGAYFSPQGRVLEQGFYVAGELTRPMHGGRQDVVVNPPAPPAGPLPAPSPIAPPVPSVAPTPAPVLEAEIIPADTVRLDEAGKPLAELPVADQKAIGDCFGEVAAAILTAALQKAGAYDPAHPVSGIYLAMSTFKGSLGASWGISYDPKAKSTSDQYRFFFEGGNSMQAAAAALESSGVRYRAAEYYVPANVELDLCDNNLINWLYDKDKLVAYWQAHASAEEKAAVISGAARPAGAHAAMQDLLDQVRATCAPSRRYFKVSRDYALRMQAARDIPDTKLGHANYQLSKLLTAGYPSAFEVCADSLTERTLNITPGQGLRRCGSALHVVLIDGRRMAPAGGQLQFLVRNSWGRFCDYREEFRAGCEADKGSFWVDADKLFAIRPSWSGAQSGGEVQALPINEEEFIGPDGVAMRTAAPDPISGAARTQLVFLDARRAAAFRGLKDMDGLVLPDGYGGLYQGPVRKGAPAGVGLFSPPSGEVIQADFAGGFSGVKQAKARVGLSAYEGEITDLRITGTGVMTLRAGERVVKLAGRFVDGAPVGKVSVSASDTAPVGVEFEAAAIKPGSELDPNLARAIERELQVNRRLRAMQLLRAMPSRG